MKDAKAVATDKRSRRKPAALATVAAAAEWRLIGLLLERPRPGWREEIEALAGESGDDALRRAAASAGAANEGTYLHLVGPGGLVSPREVSYRPMEDPGWVLADLRRFYDAFAFHPRAEDPIDHIAVETSFVGYLFLKEAFARAGGDDVAAETTAAARRDFLEAHLGSIAHPFAERLEALARSCPLSECARLLAARAPVRQAVALASATADAASPCGSCAAI